MTGALLALALAAREGALPTGAVRWRAELGGVPVGVAELVVACTARSCTARWTSRLRLPLESGGGLSEAAVDVDVDRGGRFRGGALRVRRGGASRAAEGVVGAVPSALVEVALAAAPPPPGAAACLDFFEEERPERRRACAWREGAGLAADVGGVPVRIVEGPEGLPAEIAVGRRFRYVRDPGAEVPSAPPLLAGTRVPGPADPDGARSFCGVPRDPAPAAPGGAPLPPPRAEGESCRDRTAAWLAEARARGLEGRTAVGAAFDGTGFVWHAWAEVRVGSGWLPVDPSFGESPARGPRFTVARFAEGDAAAREAAGVRIMGCWGSAQVE